MNTRKRTQIIKKVTELLEVGKKEAANHSDPIEIEGCRFYAAQDFLVREAIETEFDEELDQRFCEVVPRNKFLKKRLSNELLDIRSAEEKKRLAAAKVIDKETRGTLDGERSLWLRHPETSKTLCDALVVESNTKVRELLVVVLGVMYSRNIRDPRIFEAVLPLVSSSETNLSRLAVIAISDSTDVRKWGPLLSLFRNCKTQKMMDALLMHLWQIPAEYKKLIIEILIGYFVQKKLTGESGRNVAQGIYSVVDENLIEWFRLQYH